MSNFNLNYDYKQREKRNGENFVSIRDKRENALLEVKKMETQ